MVEKVYKMSSVDGIKVIEPVIKDENLHYMHMVLPKGESLPLHNTNANVYMTIAQGKLSIALNDNPVNVYTKGVVLNIPKGSKMDVSNENEEILELYVVKSPAPQA